MPSKLSKKQIAEDRRLHNMWLRNEPGGKCIDWSGANLTNANLTNAKLDGADLTNANLTNANLININLYGADLTDAGLTNAINFSPFVCIGPIGSRLGYTTISLVKDEVVCGCFIGTLKEFEQRVKKNHSKNPLYLAEYTAVIALAHTLRNARRK